MTEAHSDGPATSPEGQASAEPAGGAQQVEELRPEMGGRWEVRTRSSTHIWDLDAMTYTRLPGEDSTFMPYDEEEMPLTRVDVWPAVGHRTLLFFDDPEDPTTEHWRICSRIRSITRVGSSTAPRAS